MTRPATRRRFLTSTAAALAAAPIAHAAHVGGNDMLKVGLIGCGGRGTGAATQALTADKNVKLWAMADAFRDRLDSSLATLQKDQTVSGKLEVPRARQFVGFNAYQQVIDSGVDVVLLCSPPGFRPQHLRAAVAARKHIFAEKPVAVDAPGVRACLAACAEARRNNLSVVSGLCLRYSTGYREMMRRVHDGAIGDVVALEANDLRGPIWVHKRQKAWSDMEWQMRNWYYFTWLSGDFNVEQHVHNLDVCAWALRDTYPARCVGIGGRQVRTGSEFGHIYDHFSVMYECANGTRIFSQCRQQVACHGDMTVWALGARGKAQISERRLAITGGKPWQLRGKDNDFYQAEHDELFAGIRKGRPLNNGEYMCKSTLMAIMARMAAYTGQAVTWEQALNSKEDLTPPRYEWGNIATPPVAMPGVTQLI